MGINKRNLNNDDTIAAIATALNNAGIGIIRISGSDSILIADKIFKAKKNKKLSEVNTHTINYGYIIDENDTKIDEVLVSVMKAPNTFTREDVVEINCHGGVLVMKKVLEEVIKAGARMAEPGEFTKRAFINGRIDLSQAEAVIDIINAKNDFALKTSLSHLQGDVSHKVKELRDIILDKIAYIEAALDDPEHIELEGYASSLLKDILIIKNDLEKMILSFENGRILTEGIKTVILGKPNVGKSSFLNVLIGHERAIVTDIEGTTRDTLEETININGITLNLVDTAGLRKTDDVIEKIGVKKAKEEADKADLILYLIDSSKSLDKSDLELLESIKDKKAIILLNKADLESLVAIKDIEKITDKQAVLISAKTKDGIDEFENILRKMFLKGEINYNDELCITNIRHKTEIVNAKNSINMVIESIENNMPEDFFTIDLMNAYESMGIIIGEAIEEDLADRIFCKFCMGK